MDYNKAWKFAMEAYKGDGGFEDKSYLDKHIRESDEKYENRQLVTDYSNIFVQKVGRYEGYLFKQKPTRTTKDAMIKAIIEDCDNAGNHINVYMSGFAKELKVRGVGLVLVDMDRELPSTVADQIEQRKLPYFVSVKPENVTSYKLDKFGKFEYIAYKDVIDDSTFGNPNKQNIIRYYDTTKWATYEDNEDQSFIEGEAHDLGICPVLYCGENGVFPDVGEFTQVANISKRHFNLESEIDDILRGQTFSILTIQADNPSDVKITLSTDNAIKYGKGMAQPGFIAPDASPASTYENRINKLEARIDEITYDVTTGLGAESGIALDIKFQGLNGSLANIAMRLEDFEARLFEVVNKYLDSNKVINIVYPDSFNIIDLAKEIATLDKIKSLGYTLPTYELIKLKQIISNDLSSLSMDQIDKVTTEIEDVLKEVK